MVGGEEVSSLTSPKVVTQRRKEAAFQRAVEDFAQTLGWFCFHLYNARQSKAGFPDLMLVKDRVVWIELKVYYDNGRAGRVMQEQARFHDMLRAAGQEVYVIYDDDDGWAEITRVLSDGRLTP
jgi:hypothetical protein